MILTEMIILEDVYRRLGYPVDNKPDEYTCQKINEVMDQVMKTAAIRSIKKEFTVISLEPFLTGKDIDRHLVHCHKCLLIAATLGSQIDTLIRKASVSDMNEAVIMDAVTSILIEGVVEEFEALVRDEYHQQGLYVTSRFSPGYGDFPITVQNELLRLLDAGRKIGLYATPTHILTPRKSITAVCGISTQPVTGHLAGCDTCALESVCQNKKEGNTCARSSIKIQQNVDHGWRHGNHVAKQGIISR